MTPIRMRHAFCCGVVSLGIASAFLGATNLHGQSIFTIVGGGTNDGFQAKAAALDQPWAVTVDRGGNLYIADGFLHRVRKVSAATGVISTVAGDGAGAFGGDGLVATSAQMFSPRDVSLDPDGNLVIMDQGNSAIRRVDLATGIIATIAGRGSSTADNIPATQAALSFPSSLTVDGSGDIYIADGSKIREITRAGLIRTVVASQAAGIAVDSPGRFLYFSDVATSVVKKMDLVSGSIVVFAGTGASGFGGDNGLATAASLSSPGRLILDSANNLFISDAGNHRVRRVDGQTNVITSFISSIGTPMGLAVDASGDVFAVDQATNSVFRVNTVNGAITTVVGTGERGFYGDGSVGPSASLLYPSSIAQNQNGDIFVADAQHHRVRVWSHSTTTVSTVAGTGTDGYSGDRGPATSAQLRMPEGVAYDGGANELYIADKLNHVVRKVNLLSGVITTVAGSGIEGDGGDGGPSMAASFGSPTRVAFDPSSQVLYILDQDHNRVRAVKNGAIMNFAGGGSSFLDHVAATTALLRKPVEITLDPTGNLYIADNLDGRVRKVNAATGEITTVAGNGIPGFSGDPGPATGASIKPFALAFDVGGNLFVSDSPASNSNGTQSASHRIRKIDSSGTMITIIGSGPTDVLLGSFEGDNGAAIKARLNNPQSMVVDSQGNIFLADTFNNRIREVIGCHSVQPPALSGPPPAANGVPTAPTLTWNKVDGAFTYDLNLGITNPPGLAARDLSDPAFVPSNLAAGTTYYWQVLAKGDKFCPSQSTTSSEIRSFTTAAGCAATSRFDLSQPGDNASSISLAPSLTWQSAAGAASYDVYFGPSVSPPLFASGVAATNLAVTGLTAQTKYFWFVVAHSLCDATKTTFSSTRSFNTAGSCSPAGTFNVVSPSSGATNVASTTTLQWSPSSNATSYDVYLGTSSPPSRYLVDLPATTTHIGVSGLLASRTYSWQVVARVGCDPSKNIATATSTFSTADACTISSAPAITFAPPGNVGEGQTYTVAWSESPNLDTDGYYVIERSTNASFVPLLDSQQTFSTSASFVGSNAGLYYHRVRAVPACDPSRRSTNSDVRTVNVVSGTANVIFTVEPQAVITTLGEKLEDRRARFTLENLGSTPLAVIVTRAELTDTPFFRIRDPLGGNPAFVTLQPRTPKSFEIDFSGPPNDVPGTYQGVVSVNAVGQSLTITPYAFVNLKVGGGATSRPVFVNADGTPTEYAFFPAFAGDDSNRVPITVFIRNGGTAPMDLGAEVGPDLWLVPDAGWNSTSILPGTARPVQLRTQRSFAPNGSALPRYTYFRVRSKSGDTARLLVQDNDAPSTSLGRASALAPGSHSLILPGVVSTKSQFSRIHLTNVGSEPVQTTLFFTPVDSDGLSGQGVRQATVLVPPNDVVTLTDPLNQLFGIPPPTEGQVEVRAAPERLGFLIVSASVFTPAIAGGAYRFEMPTVLLGEGARVGSPHAIAGVTANATTRASLTLVETTGLEVTRARVVLFDARNTKLGERVIDVPRYGDVRIDGIVAELGGSEPFDAGRVEINVDSGGGAVAGVVTIVDSTNNNGVTLLSQPVGGTVSGSSLVRLLRLRRPSADPSVTAVAPIVIDGLSEGVVRRTTMGFALSSGSPASAVVTYRPMNTAAPTISKTVALTPGVILQIDNVLEDLFGTQKGETNIGAIFVQSAAGLQIYVRLMSLIGSNWNVTGGLPIVPTLSDVLASVASKRPLYLDGLEQSADPARGTRWNVLLTETGGFSGSAVVRLYEAGNRSIPIGEKPFNIAPYGQLRLETVFSALDLDTNDRRKDRTNVMCVVIPESGGLVISAVGEAIDNLTGDTHHVVFSPTGGTPATGIFRFTTVTPVLPPPPIPGRRRAVNP